MDNEELLNMRFKICDNLQYEVDEEGIVTILEKQDHKIQRFFRKLKFKIPMYKRTSLDECFYKSMELIPLRKLVKL